MSFLSFSILLLLLTQSSFLYSLSSRPLPLSIVISPIFILLTLRVTSSSLALSFLPIVLLAVHMLLGVSSFPIPDPSYLVFALSLLFFFSLTRCIKDVLLQDFVHQLRFYLCIISSLYIIASLLIPDITAFVASSSSPIGYRMKLFFIEPSHLGLFLTPLCFVAFSLTSLVLLLFILLSFSQTSYLIILLVFSFALFRRSRLFFSRETKIAALLSAGVLSSFLILRYLPILSEPSSYLLTSGTIRFIGLTLFLNTSYSISHLLFGSGFTSADNVLQDFFSSIQVEYSNTFLFGAAYDLGLLFFGILISLLYRYLSVSPIVFIISFLLVFSNLPITQPLSYLYFIVLSRCLQYSYSTRLQEI